MIPPTGECEMNLEQLKAHASVKSAEYAAMMIDETARKTPIHSARMAMAKLAASRMSNYTEEGRALWQAYYDAGAPKS